MTFSKWIDTFLAEKGVDEDRILIVDGPSGPNHIPVGCLVDAIKSAPKHEQASIKAVIVKIDFLNGDILDYLRHIAQAIAI